MRSVQKITSEPEWLSWSQTMNLLKAGGVNFPWQALPSWCASGRVQARAAAMVGVDDFPPNKELPADFWRLCNEHKIEPDPMNGSIQAPFNGDLATLVGLTMLKDDVLKLVSHLSDDEVEAALQATPWMSGKPKAVLTPPVQATPEQPKRGGGAPPKIKAWHAFYLLAMKMIENGEVEAFEKQTEWREAILLRLDREGHELSDDAIKGPVRDIWHQVLNKL